MFVVTNKFLWIHSPVFSLTRAFGSIGLWLFQTCVIPLKVKRRGIKSIPARLKHIWCFEHAEFIHSPTTQKRGCFSCSVLFLCIGHFAWELFHCSFWLPVYWKFTKPNCTILVCAHLHVCVCAHPCVCANARDWSCLCLSVLMSQVVSRLKLNRASFQTAQHSPFCYL